MTLTKNPAITALLIALAPLAAAAQPQSGNVLDLRHSLEDNSITYPESFETDAQRMLEGWYLRNYTATDDRYATMPDATVSDAEIQRRLAALPTVIDMPFNPVVRSYIDRYTRNARAQVAVILGLSHYYMPIFEQALEERGLPLELKYLPVIESGLDPNAVSVHGAAGLWQFMIGTAKGLGLEVNSLVDERRDPYASSATAAAYLKELYDTYGDWSLAIAAYNCGPGAVNKAIRRAGGDPKQHDFWSIYEYLTPETRGYVPMFIAANYVMNYYPRHNISPVMATKPLVTDTLQVSDRVHFDQISAVLGMPVDELRILNPQFRADIIPGNAETAYTLVLPAQQVKAYIMSEDAIKNYQAERYARRETAEPGSEAAAAAEALTASLPAADTDTPVSDAALAAAEMEGSDVREQLADAPTLSADRKLQATVHKVAPGETLSSIAAQYGVTVQEIKDANGLRRNAIRVGQQLRLNVAASGDAKGAASTAKPADTGAKTQSKAKQQPSKTQKAAAPKPVTHTIKNGESLSSIAKKYGVTVDQLKKANGMTNDNLRAGKTLTVPSKGGSTAKKASAGKSTGKSSKTGTRKKKRTRR